jgi:hypothetical protein
VTALERQLLTLAAAGPNPEHLPTDARLSDPEHEPSAVALAQIGEALVRPDGTTHVVARVTKGPLEVQHVDELSGHAASAPCARRIKRRPLRQLEHSQRFVSRIGRPQCRQRRVESQLLGAGWRASTTWRLEMRGM